MAHDDFRFVTYNLHGLNQGLPFLQDLLKCNNIICVQEHWLSSCDGYKLTDVNNEFVVIASFAVDAVLEKGILRGRPFGGLAIFIKASIIQNFSVVCLSDRLIAIKLNKLFICNV